MDTAAATEKHIKRIYKSLGWQPNEPIEISKRVLAIESTVLSSLDEPIKPDNDLKREATLYVTYDDFLF